MSQLSNDLVSRFSNLQSQIWQNVALSVSEAAGLEVTLSDPLTVAADVSDMYGEMASPKLVIQFAFANTPENFQTILVSRETLQNIYESFTGKSRDSVDETTVSEVRPAIEAIVQGMCLAAGNLKNEAMVASGLTIRLQIFSLAPNMQNAQQLIRTNVGISAEGLNGSMTWLVDEPTARLLTGMEQVEEAQAPRLTPEDEPLGGDKVSPTGSTGGKPLFNLEDTGLDLLMDIPLEVSVELGRVKMVVRDVVELGSGSIVEIDKAAGEPVDVMVNNRLVARGEVVVIEDNFGVRITEILSPADRLAKLNEVA